MSNCAPASYASHANLINCQKVAVRQEGASADRNNRAYEMNELTRIKRDQLRAHVPITVLARFIVWNRFVILDFDTAGQRFTEYYHRTRTHLALQKDAPETRPIQSPSAGQIIAIPEVGGLHHRYERRAA